MFNKTDPNKEKLERLYKLKANLETNNFSKPVVDLWKQYERLDQMQKNSIRVQWDKYFCDVRDTVAFKRAKYVANIFRKSSRTESDNEEIKKLGQEAREQEENQDFELTKPPLEDPMYLENNYYVNKYKQTIRDIEFTKNEIYIDGKTDTEVAGEISSLLR